MFSIGFDVCPAIRITELVWAGQEYFSCRITELVWAGQEYFSFRITELVWAGQESFSFHLIIRRLTVGPIQSFTHWVLKGLSEW